MAMQAILKRRPDAIFIQSESSEYFHADSPDAIRPAEILNATRFLYLDVNYGRRVDSEMYEYLMDNGMTRDEYHFFQGNYLKQHSITGNDYYWRSDEHTSERQSLMRISYVVFRLKKESNYCHHRTQHRRTRTK